MADKAYISQVKLPDNKPYYIKDDEARDDIVSIKTNYVKKTDTIDKAKQLETAVTIQVGDAEQSFDGSEDISFDTADMGIVGNDIKPVASKTYTGILGTASNDAANDSFYFMSVVPDDFYTQWKLYYKITATVPGHNEYHATSYVILHGYGQAAIPSYRIFNIIYSDSYRPYYFHNFYRLTSAGFNAGYGNAVGVGLRASNARNTAGYERTITIDLLKTEGCTATFLPNAIKWADWPNNTSTYYAGLTEFDGCNNGLRETGVANANTYDRRYMGGTRLLAGGVGIFAYSLVMQTSDGTWQSLTTTGGNGTAKAVNPIGFLPNSIYWHYYSAIAAGSLSTNGYLYETMAAGDLTYTFNCGKTLTTNRSVYLVGTMDNGLFYVDPSMYSQELPSSNDGKYYIYLGEATSNYQMSLSALHPIYHYKDGKIVTGITSSSDVTEALGFTPVNKAGDTMSGNLTIENTDPILNIKNTGTGNSQIVLERAGSSAADWKIINNSGLLKFQNNYTTQQTTFFDVLSLAFNTGNAVFKGSVQASSFSGNASSATKFNSNRTISLSGDITGSATSNGESGWSITNAVIGNSKVTNAMLAGSIENGKLKNSKVTIAGNEISLGGSLEASTLRTSLGLSSAMHFIGIATNDITDGGTQDPGIANYSTKAAGDVIIDSSSALEYVWTGSKWERLGLDGSYLLTSGGEITGTLTLSKATDLSGTANNSPALIVGGKATAAHMEVDANEIQAKKNGTSVDKLYLNYDGGEIYLGPNVTINGSTVTATTFEGNAAAADRLRNINDVTVGGLHYYASTVTIGTGSGNAAVGSNASPTLWSYPEGGTTATSTTANISVIRAYWSPNGDKYYRDIFLSPNNQDIYHRTVRQGTAYDWRKVLDSANYSSYALPLTGGTVSNTITANKAGEVGFIANNTSKSHQVEFISGASGNGGVYDRTNAKWVVYSDTSGNVTLNGNASSATYSSYAKIVATNEIRFDAATKPSSAVTLHFGYKWSDGSSDALINRYRFDNGAGEKAEVEASTFYGNLSGIATSATILKAINKDGAAQSGSTNRPTTANNVYHDGGLRYYLATSSMATGKPDGSGHIIHLPWDNGNWDSQIALLSSGQLQTRTQNNSANWDGREWNTILDENNFSDYTWPKFHLFNATSSSSDRYVKIKINTTSNWMLAFTVHLYNSYHHKDIRVSGYNYSSTGKWQSPKATLIDSDDNTTIVVSFGYEGNNDLWVAIPVGNYVGVSITDIVNGYVEITQSEMNNLFTLTMESSKPGTLQQDVTAYPPIKSNQTIEVANGGTGATTAAGARTNLGLGSIATYDAATAGTKDTWGKVPVIGAGDGVMEVGKYIDFHTTDGNTSDYDVRVTASTTGLTITGTTQTKILRVGVNGSDSGVADGGLALYSATPSDYGIAFRRTNLSANSGTHGYVTSDWAIYNYSKGTETTHLHRGWIYRNNYTAENIASISGEGHAVFNGSVTVGGNAANNSGCRMEYISETNSMNFVFN